MQNGTGVPPARKELGEFCCCCHSLGDAVCMSLLTLAARAVEAGVTDTEEMPRTTVDTGTAVETRVAGTSAACNVQRQSRTEQQ